MGEPAVWRTARLGIVGAGAVGSTMAYAALMRGAAQTVALYDINAAKVQAEVLDLSHGIEFLNMARVEGSDDIEVLRGCDVVVFTAGAKQKPGQTRMDLASATVNLVRTILPKLIEVAPNAIHVMVTNPVDVVTYAALKVSGLSPQRLFGSGTVLDSSRLRFLLAQATGVDVQNVHAFVVGEHGDSELPVWSSATIGPVPLLEWAGVEGRPPLSQTDLDTMAHDVVNSAYRIIEGKGATNYAIGLAGARIIEAVLRDESRILAVSSLLTSYRGDPELDDVCLSVPSLVDASGVGQQLVFPMSGHEVHGLRESARTVREAARSLGF